MLPTREQEVEEAIRLCCAEASTIASVILMSSLPADPVDSFDEGVKEGVSGALAPLYSAMYDLEVDEQEELRERLYAAVRGTVLAVRSYRTPVGRA